MLASRRSRTEHSVQFKKIPVDTFEFLEVGSKAVIVAIISALLVLHCITQRSERLSRRPMEIHSRSSVKGCMMESCWSASMNVLKCVLPLHQQYA